MQKMPGAAFRHPAASGRIHFMKKKLKTFILSFSYGERRKKEYEEYQKRRDSLKAMPKEELLFECVRTNTEYGYQENVFMVLLTTSFMIFLILGLVFWKFMKNICTYATTLETGGMEMVKIGTAIALMVVFFILFIIFLLVHQKMKELKRIRNELSTVIFVIKEMEDVE